MVDEKDLQDDLDEILDKVTADRVKELRHGDSLLTGGKQSYQSVIQKMATAIGNTDTDYRQALLLASFLSPEESDKATSAISECKRYGVDITPIIDRISARCGVKGATGGRVENIIEALTHQSITSNIPGGTKKGFLNNRNKKDSPIG